MRNHVLALVAFIFTSCDQGKKSNFDELSAKHDEGSEGHLHRNSNPTHSVGTVIISGSFRTARLEKHNLKSGGAVQLNQEERLEALIAGEFNSMTSGDWGTLVADIRAGKFSDQNLRRVVKSEPAKVDFVAQAAAVDQLLRLNDPVGKNLQFLKSLIGEPSEIDQDFLQTIIGEDLGSEHEFVRYVYTDGIDARLWTFYLENGVIVKIVAQ